jgi:hypothetical protein
MTLVPAFYDPLLAVVHRPGRVRAASVEVGMALAANMAKPHWRLVQMTDAETGESKWRRGCIEWAC